jgi:hypothetical protein
LPETVFHLLAGRGRATEGEVWRKRPAEHLMGRNGTDIPRGNFERGDTTMTDEQRKMTAEEIEKWLSIRKEAGLHIDSETAEVE